MVSAPVHDVDSDLESQRAQEIAQLQAEANDMGLFSRRLVVFGISFFDCA